MLLAKETARFGKLSEKSADWFGGSAENELPSGLYLEIRGNQERVLF